MSLHYGFSTQAFAEWRKLVENEPEVLHPAIATELQAAAHRVHAKDGVGAAAIIEIGVTFLKNCRKYGVDEASADLWDGNLETLGDEREAFFELRRLIPVENDWILINLSVEFFSAGGSYRY